MVEKLNRSYRNLPKPVPGPQESVFRRKGRALQSALLTPVYLLAAALMGAPGTLIHAKITALGIRLLMAGKYMPRLFFSPMDSVRYFEFDFVWKAISKKPAPARMLDLSSPRNILALLLGRFPRMRAFLVNPDNSDLVITKELIRDCGYGGRCEFSDGLVQDIHVEKESYDFITSISVIEHMPLGIDMVAVAKMWSGLKVGGTLVITVPCAVRAFEEYLDFNEYHLLPTGDDGFSFSQRFYDWELLEQQIFSVTGRPDKMEIFGERQDGLFLENRASKFRPRYPNWKEPYLTGKAFKLFERLDQLPGMGVIAMEFSKRA